MAVTALLLSWTAPAQQRGGSYQDLLTLFEEFVVAERPVLKDGAPDYTVPAVTARARTLKALQSRLTAIDRASWPVEQQVDHALVRALMNGMDFDLRILKPWERDPAYYQSIWTAQSDTPAHEGPTHHAVVELWTYAFPLSKADEAKLTAEIRTIPSLYAQANEFDIAEAKAFQAKWTPRGWMRPDLDLLGFEQQLYLRQPGYGTSYVTGKHLIEELIKDRASQVGEKFTLRGYFDEFNAAGVIPVSLIRWQMTGRPNQE